MFLEDTIQEQIQGHFQEQSIHCVFSIMYGKVTPPRHFTMKCQYPKDKQKYLKASRGEKIPDHLKRIRNQKGIRILSSKTVGHRRQCLPKSKGKLFSTRYSISCQMTDKIEVLNQNIFSDIEFSKLLLLLQPFSGSCQSISNTITR